MIAPIDCRRAERLLVDRLTATGPERAAPGLESHLQGCPSCRAHLDRLQSLIHVVRADDVPDPGPAYWQGFSARVQRGLAAMEAAPAGDAAASRMGGWAVAASLAAAALLVLVWAAVPGAGRPSATAPVDTLAQEAGEEEPVEHTLDAFLGGQDAFEMAEELGDLSLDERRALLEKLRAELEEPA